MIVGIDLGTTNSALAYWNNGRPELVPNSLGHFLTPSAVSLADDDSLLVGLAARERQATHPDRTVTAFKRFMGTGRKVTLGRRQYSAEELSAMVLSALKADAEHHLGVEVTSAVITVPAYFNDKQRRATRRAGELAGLKVERLINEPTAAALAFGIHDRALEEPFLVFDLGGGTFDVSLVEMFSGIIEVRASAGDNRLGGEDFNQALVQLVRTRLRDEIPENAFAEGNALYELMRDAAERTRRALTDADEAVCRFVWKGREYSTPITAEDFAEAAAPLIERLREPVLRSLRDGSTRVDALAEIVLVGGSTRMPLVRKAVTKMFGRFPDSRVHPDHAVALGAAVQAGLRARDADLDEVRLTDVCPFTLGVGVSERDAGGNLRHGLFSPIIERNTVIPASRIQRYYSIADNQTNIVLEVYQGEARNVADNVGLGSLNIPIPSRRAGEVSVDCRFTYDTSGLLEVDVTVPGTDITRQLLIYDREDAALVAGLEERRAHLASIKLHPRDMAANAAALARAERCYEGHLGDMRTYIGQLISGFESALDRQDPRTIETARAELMARLDEVEGEQFL